MRIHSLPSTGASSAGSMPAATVPLHRTFVPYGRPWCEQPPAPAVDSSGMMQQVTDLQAGAGPVPHPSAALSISASAVVSALSYALDLTEGQPMGHAVQTCLLGMRIAECLDLSPEVKSDLYYALLLKDAGCSSNSSKLFQLLQSDEIRAKRDLKDKDWTKPGLDRLRYTLDHVATGKPFLERVRAMVRLAANKDVSSCDLVKLRCERGASIARRIGFSVEVAAAIGSLDEHWDGRGYPFGLKGKEIPLLSRIMNLAQTLAVFWTLGGPEAAAEMLQRRVNRWFDPELVQIAILLDKQETLWTGMGDDCIFDLVQSLEPVSQTLTFSDGRVDDLCFAFSEVIDSKSPFTFRHSQGVALAAVQIGRHLGLTEEELRMMNRAGLLHDIGKLSFQIPFWKNQVSLTKPSGQSSRGIRITRWRSCDGSQALKH